MWYYNPTMIDVDEQKIRSLLTRGVEEIIVRDELHKKLSSGKQLRIKFGIDPTSPFVHIGRSIPLLKLRDFQLLGHTIVFIVGDFTSVIGDTSDKESERPMLDSEVIRHNMETYRMQVGKILDMDLVEWHYNTEWLEKLTYRAIGEHADLFSVSDFIARDVIKRRLDAGKRVSLRELLYPLMQGYDSVSVHADVEIGGTDQRFNLLAGRTMQPHFKQEAQHILMMRIVDGTDGRKMSSSWGNTINILDTPHDMYGKIMRMQDENIIDYFTLCTRIAEEEIDEITKELASGANPRDIKMKLAYTMVSLYHGDDEAQKAEKYFVSTFQKHEIPEDVINITAPYIDTCIAQGIFASKTEFRKLCEAGGVRNMETGEKLTTFPEKVASPIIVKIGKRRFVKLLPM